MLMLMNRFFYMRSLATESRQTDGETDRISSLDGVCIPCSAVKMKVR